MLLDAIVLAGDGAVAAWQAKDPLIRTRLYLESVGMWDDKKQTELEERAKKIVGEVVKTAEGIEKPHPSDFFNSMYAALPRDLAEQRDTMRTSSIGRNPSQAAQTCCPVFLSKP